MHVRGARAVAARVALGEHAQHGIVLLAFQIGIRRGVPEQIEEAVFAPFGVRDLRDDLLREHVERRARDMQQVEFAAPHAIEQRCAFDQIVARSGEEPPLRHAADVVPRASYSLQKRRDRARRAHLADEIDIADIDAEFQRSRRDQHAQFASLQALLGVEAVLFRERAVVRGDGILAEPLGQMPRDALGHPARVDEHERRPVLRDEFREPVVDEFPRFVRHHRFERHGRHFEREIALAHVTDVDDRAVGGCAVVGGAIGRAIGPVIGRAARHAVEARAADEKARDGFDGLLRRRQADARQAPAAQRIEPFERQREMAAALAARHRVNFVDDHRAHGRQHLAPRLRSEQHVQRFGRRDENMRRALLQRGALLLRRVARAHGRADVKRGQPAPREFARDSFERRLQVDADVVRQRLQR